MFSKSTGQFINSRREWEMDIRRPIMRRPFMAIAFATLALAGATLAQTVEVTRITPASQVMIAKRMTLAVNYREGNGTEVNMVGTALNPQAMGKADVKRK